MLRKIFLCVIATLFVFSSTVVAGLYNAEAKEKGPIKIAFLDPLSGAFGDVGDTGARHFAFMAEKINAEGGVLGGRKLEMVYFDSKLSPKESVIQLKNAINQGIHFVVHGNMTSISAAIISTISKHNRRNPDKTIMYLNYASVTPAFTQKKCNFWHFRFDSHVDIKVKAIVDAISQKRNIKRVYLINQDYSFGKSVSNAAKRMLKVKRPDIKIVGDTFHPIGRVKDFSAYVARIKKSNADAVITGNWGSDMTLLAKSANEIGLKSSFYTFYAGALGGPSAMGKAVNGLNVVVEWHPNLSSEMNRPFDGEFYEKYLAKNGIKKPFYYYRVKVMLEMLVRALNIAGKEDPKAVAYALENMRHPTVYGEVYMRGQDHQIFTPLYIATFVPSDGKKVKYDIEGSGYGPSTISRIEAKDTELPSSCKMKRP